ncbi:DUF1538 domain-containing protein [Pontiellaceae bacterium B12219]|nr:DUF1538 domain-containing protein [Pontiellaceae bacterium B12219]
MQTLPKIHIPLRAAIAMVRDYARSRVMEQVKSVAFIILYLIGFQMLVLRTAPAQALQISVGVGMVVFGLTFFLEGLFLGLMPLGERVGLQLPQRGGIVAIIVFGLLLGVGSTLAEPAIAALQVAGQSVTPWVAPLLFRLLENEPGKLVISIGAGVGVAVAFGMVRFYYGVSIKPFVFILIPLLLIASVACALDPNLNSIIGLAWDAGAVTTGPVTVPLVLALGIGVSRAIGKQKGGSSGFGIVMMASAFPVLGVLILGAMLNSSTPAPVSEADFFSPAHRQTALQLVDSDNELLSMAFQRGGETGRQAFFADEEKYRETVTSLKDPVVRRNLLGKMSLQEWFLQRASDTERAWIPVEFLQKAPLTENSGSEIVSVLRVESGRAMRAVIPLTALLLIVLLLFLRDKLQRADEVVLGIGFTIIGMILLASGIHLGLAPLGDQVGRPLPRVFQSVALEEGRILLEPFDPGQVLTSFQLNGESEQFFYLKDRRGTPRPVPFDPARYDPQTQRYEHIIKRPPLFGPKLTLAGIGLVLLFAFGMGFGSTLAEPALRALGRTVEELTVGTIKRTDVVRAVSIGVGLGLIVGVARILYEIPTIWVVVPPYLLLLLLTFWSEEEFAGIAWDCGGVTTGPVTVPLVLAMGMGIGGELNVIDGFGVLAMASAYPVITVLLYGMIVRIRQRRSFERTEKANENG